MRFDRDGYSVDAARKKKRKLPDWYLNEPAEPPQADFFYDAFRDLATCRPPDGGAIPWDKAMAYADRKGLKPDVADALWTVIRKMDQAERLWQVDNLKAGDAGGG
ncbi:MAG: hypothetical protein WKF79_00385 [Nocardioides sp.]